MKTRIILDLETLGNRGGMSKGYERRCELLKLIVAKHRGGPIGDIDLAWEGPITQIHSLTPCLYSNDEAQRKHTV